MRYTKTALLTFGAGLVLGLVVIAIEVKWLERVASALMALGITAIPFGMLADWRHATKAVRRAPRRHGRSPTRRVSTAARARARPRKSPSPKR